MERVDAPVRAHRSRFSEYMEKNPLQWYDKAMLAASALLSIIGFPLYFILK